MSILQRLQTAESTFNEALGVAEEIVTLGEDLLAKLTAHRDDLRAAAGTMLERIGGVATASRAEAPVVPPSPAPSPAPSAGPAPDWSALQGQAASLPG